MKQTLTLLFYCLCCTGNLQAQCWQSLAASAFHTNAVKSDGTLWSWGRNTFGQLGDGTTDDKLSPTQIGTDHNWKSVYAGDFFAIALKTDGTLWAWGQNTHGQLGIGNQIDQNSPVQIGTDTDWETASAGGFFSMALKTNGTLWTWGYNFFGQLGIGTNINQKSPVQVGTSHAWKTISAGWAHALALQADATLWAWGYNYSGQVGNGTNQHPNTPQQISQDKHWTQIAAGGFHSLALTNAGALYTWGDNEYGALGVDSTTTATNIPQQMGSNTDWNYIDAGTEYTLALKTNGTLWTWGGNYYGQLGDGTNVQKNSPVQIGTDQDWTTLTSCYDYHTFIVKTDGSLWACGRNHKGQLGNGTTTNQSNFTQIACPTVAVLNPAPAPQFEIVPNPVSEQIKLQWTNEEWSSVQFEISNLLGQTILSKQSLPFEQQIRVETLPNGVYFLHLYHAQGQFSRSFVKI